MVVFSLLVIGKIIYFQFFYDKEKIKEAIKSTRVYSTIEPNRGDIYSSDGKLLATSVAYFEAGIDPNCDALTQEVFDKNIDSLTLCLSQIFPSKTQQQFKQELISARDQGSRYYRFSFNIKYSDFKTMQTFPLLRLGRTKGGFVYQKTYRREKPFGELSKRTIGTEPGEGIKEVGFFKIIDSKINLNSTNSNKGRKGVGLEEAFDKDLRGIEGYAIKEKIPGNMWMPVEDDNFIEPQDGYDLIATIDIGLQDVAETALEKQLIKHAAEYGTVVVMEVKTGKVRAIANLKLHPDGYYYEETNFAVGHASDPGSTFKLASVIVALEDGYIKADDLIETGNGITYYYGKEMKDTKEGGYGTITVQRAFEVSSNVGISKIIDKEYRHQPGKYIAGLQRLHLHEPLGVIIKGEPTPVIHSPGKKGWSGISLTQTSVGYELQITPLQILAFYNAIANNGVLLRPIFAEALSYRGEIIKTFEPEIIDSQICSQETIDIVKKMMEGVVTDGTAKNIKSDNFKIAGKTGTAQMNYGSDSTSVSYHASFVGYFPAEDPEYSCIVSIYEPKRGGFYGNVVAGPVFKEIANKIYASNPKYHRFTSNFTISSSIPLSKKGNKNETESVYHWLQIITDAKKVAQTEWIISSAEDLKVVYSPVNYSDKTKIPNVINMGLKDAIVILEQCGLKIHISGRGRVKRQIPAPGNGFKKGDLITLYLGE